MRVRAIGTWFSRNQRRGGWYKGTSTCEEVECIQFGEGGVGKGWVFSLGFLQSQEESNLVGR